MLSGCSSKKTKISVGRSKSVDLLNCLYFAQDVIGWASVYPRSTVGEGGKAAFGDESCVGVVRVKHLPVHDVVDPVVIPSRRDPSGRRATQIIGQQLVV